VKPKYGQELTANPVPLSTKEIVLEPHLEVPSAEPQTMLIVSGMFGLNVIVWVAAVEYTDIEVAEAKTAEGVVVKAAGLKVDVLQLQSASAANPAYLKSLP
jgi:hypothetical protein